VAARLEKAEAALNDAIRDLRRSLGELRTPPSPLASEPVAAALRRVGEDPRYSSLVDVALSLELAESETLSPVQTHHVLAIVGEALSNVVRHSRALRVPAFGQPQHLPDDLRGEERSADPAGAQPGRRSTISRSLGRGGRQTRCPGCRI